MFDPSALLLQENSRKQPFYVNIGEGSVMRMAGLFDVWSAGDDIAPLYTYTILTTDSSKRLAWYAPFLRAACDCTHHQH